MKLYKQEKQVKAMKILLNHYTKIVNDEKSYIETCPLCTLTHCPSCVWMVEKKHTCTYELLSDNFSSISNMHFERNYNKKWAKHRISQLRNWIEKYD